MGRGAVVRGLGDVGLEDGADRAVAGRRRQIFNVFVIGADIADMREGEGDDLAEIRRIGQDLFVAGQCRVEADFRLDLAVAPMPWPSMTVPSARTRRRSACGLSRELSRSWSFLVRPRACPLVGAASQDHLCCRSRAREDARFQP